MGLARALEVRVGEWMARSICEIPGNQTTARSLTNAGSSTAAIAATLHDGLSISFRPVTDIRRRPNALIFRLIEEEPCSRQHCAAGPWRDRIHAWGRRVDPQPSTASR